ncbi:spermidine resistance protein [Phlyctochytrium planicorne]|nr:spermidine resistance protein [Phlyctochytrium planicorne]
MVHSAKDNNWTPPAALPNTHAHLFPENPSDEKNTLSGFEGPEKLLEIWFKTPSVRRPSVVDGPLLFSHGHTIIPNGSCSDSESSDSGVDSLQGAPAHPYMANTYTDDETGKVMYRRTGLRVVPRPVWEEMLSIVKCQVLSTIHNEYMDSYLLSESSMFVYPNRLILKTCGTTTLLNAVSRILEIARSFCGMEELSAVFYSRKAFFFPEKQLFPHGRWGDEVAYLDELLPSTTFDTSAYVVGKINGDHWCLYTASPKKTHLDQDGIEIEDPVTIDDADAYSNSSNHDGEEAYGSDDEEDGEDDDVTLEIMMQGMDPNVTKLFWRSQEEQGKEESSTPSQTKSKSVHFAKTSLNKDLSVRKAERRVLEETGIANVYPNSVVDDFVFDPCGYSLNGLLGPYYYTIHVTPEDHCSYASFETSIPVKKFYPNIRYEHSHRQGSKTEYDTFEDVVSKVVECFRPTSFSVTLFTRRSVARKHGRRSGLLENGRIGGFRRTDRITHTLGKWDLIFGHYVTKGAKPTPPASPTVAASTPSIQVVSINGKKDVVVPSVAQPVDAGMMR